MSNKTFYIVEFRKEIKVCVRETVDEGGDDILVSGCDYRKRKTTPQIAYERNKWINKGYRYLGLLSTKGEAS